MRRDSERAHRQLAAHVRDGAAQRAAVAADGGAARAPARGAHRAAAAAGRALPAHARSCACRRTRHRPRPRALPHTAATATRQQGTVSIPHISTVQRLVLIQSLLYVPLGSGLAGT